MADIDNLKGGTKRTIQVNSIDNSKGGVKRVYVVGGGGGGSVDYSKTVQKSSTMPAASASNVGQVYMYTGETDQTYTHGYIYECKAQGTDPETYAWTAVEVQASSGGLPSQTGNAGKFLTTDGTDASWSDKPLVNQSTGTESIGIGSAVSQNHAIAIGPQVTINKTLGIGIGWFAKTRASSIAIGINAGSSNSATGDYSISIGGYAKAGANNTIQFNVSNGHTYINSDANTFKVANGNGNFELMDANGNLPADRLASTTGLADGNYRLRCTITNGVPTLSWVAE